MRSVFRAPLVAGLIPLVCAPALAFDARTAPSSNFNRLGVDRLTIQGSGSTGDASSLSVAPSGSASDGTLAKRLHTPSFPGPVTAPTLSLTAPGSTGDVSAMSVVPSAGAANDSLAKRLHTPSFPGPVTAPTLSLTAPGSTGDVSAMSVVPSAGAANDSLAKRLHTPSFPGPVTTPTLSLTAPGSTGDVSTMSVTAGGATRPLSTWFPLLAPLSSPTFSGTLTVPSVSLSGSGSTGDVSAMSVAPSAGAASDSLAKRLHTPSFPGPVTAPTLSLTAPGSTGDVSAMSVVPSAGAASDSLAKRLHTPSFPGPVTAPTLSLTAPGSTGDVSAMSVAPSAGAANDSLAKRLHTPSFPGPVTAPTLSLTAPGSTGDVSAMSVVPSAGAANDSLAKRLHTPSFPGPVTTPTLSLTAPGSTGDISAMSVRAPGGNVALPLSSYFARRIDVRSFGGTFEGKTRPLSERFATLAAAQAVFPFVTSLAEEQDGVAFQAAVNHCATLPNGGLIDLPAGTGISSREVWIRSSQCNVRTPAENSEQLVNSVDNSANRFTTRLKAAEGFKGTLLRISPLEDTASSKALTGSGVKGLLLDCNRQPGCTSFVQKSTSFFETNVGVNEPLEELVPVTVAAGLGSTVLRVESTASIAGLEHGASITHPSIPRGTFVRSWTPTTISISTPVGASFEGSISGTTLTVTKVTSGAIQIGAKLTGPGIVPGTKITSRALKNSDPAKGPIRNATVDGVGTYSLSGNIQTVAPGTTITTSVALGDKIGVAGEGARFDTAQTNTTNTLSWGEISVQALNSEGQAPLVLVNGAAPEIGVGGFGNPAHVTFRRVVCYAKHADCLVLGNSDHIAFEYTNFFRIDPVNSLAGNGIIALGSNLPGGTNNGPSYSNRWNYVSGELPIIIRGKEMYAHHSYGNEFAWLDHDNGTPLPTLGDEVTSYSASDANKPVGIDGGTVGVLAQLADGTPKRGGTRGSLANDLQKCRGLAYQVASGDFASILGGCVNTASGHASSVLGGYGNAAQGINSVASGAYSHALGVGWRCHAGGQVDGASVTQGCDVPLMAISNANAPIRATGDKGPATSGGQNGNCVNIPDSTAYSLDIMLTAVNRSNANQRFSWREPNALLTRLSGPASTVYTPSGQASGVGVGGWNTPGTVSVSATADTTVGCLNLAFVPPSGNADFIVVSASVRLNQAQ